MPSSQYGSSISDFGRDHQKHQNAFPDSLIGSSFSKTSVLSSSNSSISTAAELICCQHGQRCIKSFNELINKKTVDETNKENSDCINRVANLETMVFALIQQVFKFQEKIDSIVFTGKEEEREIDTLRRKLVEVTQERDSYAQESRDRETRILSLQNELNELRETLAATSTQGIPATTQSKIGRDDNDVEVEPQATQSVSATSCLMNQPLIVNMFYINENHVNQGGFGNSVFAPNTQSGPSTSNESVFFGVEPTMRSQEYSGFGAAQQGYAVCGSYGQLDGWTSINNINQRGSENALNAPNNQLVSTTTSNESVFFGVEPTMRSQGYPASGAVQQGYEVNNVNKQSDWTAQTKMEKTLKSIFSTQQIANANCINKNYIFGAAQQGYDHTTQGAIQYITEPQKQTGYDEERNIDSIPRQSHDNTHIGIAQETVTPSPVIISSYVSDTAAATTQPETTLAATDTTQDVTDYSDEE